MMHIKGFRIINYKVLKDITMGKLWNSDKDVPPLTKLTAITGKNSTGKKLKRIGIMLRGTFDGLNFFPEPERAMARKGEER